MEGVSEMTNDRIKELRELNAALMESDKTYQTRYSREKFNSMMNECLDEIERLRAGLEFYANTEPVGMCCCDGGVCARQVMGYDED